MKLFHSTAAGQLKHNYEIFEGEKHHTTTVARDYCHLIWYGLHAGRKVLLAPMFCSQLMLFYFFITNLAAQGFVTRLWEKEVRNLAVQQDQKKKKNREKKIMRNIYFLRSPMKNRDQFIFLNCWKEGVEQWLKYTVI